MKRVLYCVPYSCCLFLSLNGLFDPLYLKTYIVGTSCILGFKLKGSYHYSLSKSLQPRARLFDSSFKGLSAVRARDKILVVPKPFWSPTGCQNCLRFQSPNFLGFRSKQQDFPNTISLKQNEKENRIVLILA